MDVRKLWKRLNQGWIGIIFSIFLGVLFATFFYYVVLATALQTNLPVVAVVSSSMEHDNPELTYYGWLQKTFNYPRVTIESWLAPNGFSIGDMPIVQGSDDYVVGDIIVYMVEEQPAPIIHRIIRINDDGTYQTKGDNNLSQLSYEYSVKKEQVYGKAIFIIPKLGYVKVLASKILGI